MKAGTVLSVTGAAGHASAFAVWLGRTTPVPQLAGSGEGAVTAATAAGLPARSAAEAGPTLRTASRAAATITNPNRFLRIAFSFRSKRIQLGRSMGGSGPGRKRGPSRSNRVQPESMG